MGRKILLPIQKLDENDADINGKNAANPVLALKPISIESALIFGQTDRFYHIIDNEQNDDFFHAASEKELENSEIVSLSVIKIQYDKVPCSMILFRTWTDNFKF